MGKVIKIRNLEIGQGRPKICALIIGDTPNDISCARAVGAKALAVATGKFSIEELREHQPDFLLPDLTDIAGFLEIIGA